MHSSKEIIQDVVGDGMISSGDHLFYTRMPRDNLRKRLIKALVVFQNKLFEHDFKRSSDSRLELSKIKKHIGSCWATLMQVV